MNVPHLAAAPEAAALLSDPAFRARWATLHAACPWASDFQGPAFLTVWYRVYAPRFEPLLVLLDGPQGALAGLLPLAVERATGRLLVAGDHHAEYQAWLADEAHAETFIASALTLLAGAHGARTLRIGYVPPGAPLGWARTGRWAGRVEVRPVPRGVARTADPVIGEILGKRATRWRLNRLGRMGPIRFERLTDAETLERAMPDIATLCDFRQAAANNIKPFLDDPLKAPFHLALARETDILHATVLRAGDAVLSAQLNMRNRDGVLLCVLGHAPAAARQSPGHLHMLMLCRLLAEEGVPEFDLSPGGDYKDRIATQHDTAHDLRVHLGAWPAVRARARRGAVLAARRAAARLGSDPVAAEQRARDFLDRVTDVSPARLPGAALRGARRAVGSDVEVRVYSMPAERARAIVPRPGLHRDDVADLLRYRRVASDQPRARDFFAAAMARLARGNHVYTLRADDQLAHWGWLVERQSRSELAEVGWALRLPEHSAVLFDYYTLPAFRGRGLYRQSVSQMAHDAAALPGTEWVFITVHGDNAPSRHVIERVGFDYRGSFFEHRRLGGVRRWNTAPPDLDGGALDASPHAEEPAAADAD